MTDRLVEANVPQPAQDRLRRAIRTHKHSTATYLLILLAAAAGPETIAQAKPSAPVDLQGARQVNFDLRGGHPFLGLATVIWPGAPFAPQRRTVMSATEMSWVRIPLTTTFRESDERPGMSVQQLLAQLPNHPVRAAAEHLSPQQLENLREADQKIAERYRGLGEELNAVNIHFVIAALPGIPPDWLQTFIENGVEYKTFMGGSQPGQPDHRQDYITLVVAEIIAARHSGLGISAVEISSEPDEPGGLVRPDVANSMVGKLRNTLNENGLANIEIASPGTGSSLSAAKYVAAMKGKGGHIGEVKYFSAHEYDTAKNPAPFGLAPSFVGATHGSKPILVTEFNNDSSRWAKPPYLSDPRHLSPEEGLNPANASNHNEFAVSVVAEGLKLVSDGAAGICVWEMNDIYWKKTSYGLIDLHGNPRPTVAAFATFMKQIGRGSDIKAFGTNAGPGLGAAAFRVTRDNRTGLVAVLANVTGAPIRVRVNYQWQNATDDPGSRQLAVAATFPANIGTAHIGDSGTPTLAIPPETIVVLSNLPPR